MEHTLIGNKQKKTNIQKIIEKILNFHKKIKKKFKKEKYNFNEYESDEYEDVEINTNFERIYDPFPTLDKDIEEEIIINEIENKLTEVVEIIKEYENSKEIIPRRTDQEEQAVREDIKEEYQEDLLDFFKNTNKDKDKIFYNFFE